MSARDLETVVRQAQERDLDAFAEVVRRFQHMAFGYALSLVRDLQHAEDVVQEAFVAAWSALPTLADPAAFPGWFKSIVRHRAHRVLRRHHLEIVPLAVAERVPAETSGPEGRIERRRKATEALDATARLSAPLREVVTLFYVHECSQQDIATFLGLPVTTVNNRLHAARGQLKRRMLGMVKSTLEAHQLPDDFVARVGRIVRTREDVIEARFDPASLPDILTELTVSDEGRQRAVSVQVIQHLPDGVVRCVPLTPTDELAPGMSVMSSGQRTESRVSRAMLDRAAELLTRDRRASTAETVLETGIKVIDVMCPLLRGGTVAIAGEWNAGTVVLVEELVRRISADPAGVSIFSFNPPTPPDGKAFGFQEMWEAEGYSNGTVGSVQTFYFLGEAEWTEERLAALTGADVVIRLSRALGQVHGVYPTVDPVISRSRALDPAIVGPHHVDIARRVREALARLDASPDSTGTTDVALRRARKLRYFFSQPFFVAEPYTHRPGVTVTRTDALRTCREILDGGWDGVPEEAFSFTGLPHL
jgi:RNA polymerase sigma factor (sigma-70 family)